MVGIPARDEAAAYYYKYIDRITSADVVAVLAAQVEESMPLFAEISESASLHRYAADKWSIRQVLNHVNDAERVFAFRALWFARGFDSPLPSFDEKTGVAASGADDMSWARQIDDFRGVRAATLSLFRNLPAETWMRSGIASDNPFTVRSLAYIIAGHLAHHTAILREKYL
jgi:uncharacterized damage-inducible protein DinB